MTFFKNLLVSSLVVGLTSSLLLAEEKFVAISDGVKSVDVTLDGQKFTIMRNQTAGNKISSLYDTTDRGPPQPMILGTGV